MRASKDLQRKNIKTEIQKQKHKFQIVKVNKNGQYSLSWGGI